MPPCIERTAKLSVAVSARCNEVKADGKTVMRFCGFGRRVRTWLFTHFVERCEEKHEPIVP